MLLSMSVVWLCVHRDNRDAIIMFVVWLCVHRDNLDAIIHVCGVALCA